LIVGIKDYIERYGPSIQSVYQAQCADCRPFKQETVDLIHDAMTNVAPNQSVVERSNARDRRLSALVVHRNEEKRKQQE